MDSGASLPGCIEPLGFKGMGAVRRYEWLPTDVELVTNVSEADWVMSGLRARDEEGIRVGSFMPAVFDAYARIDQGGGDPEHGWSMRPEMLEDLASLLSGSYPLSHPCWFCLWDGWGTWSGGGTLHRVPGPDMSRKDLKALREAIRREQQVEAEREAELRRIPRVRGEHRSYFLVRGPLSAAVPLWEAAGHEPPNLWWPDDRSWLVSTEIYANLTYVGGSERLVGALVGSAALRAVEVSISDPLHPSAPGLGGA